MRHVVLKRHWIAAASMLCLALAGCDAPPESLVALSEKPTADYDKRLVGTWILMMDDDPAVLRISAGRNPRELKILWSSIQKEKAHWIAATAFATEIGGTVYYNVRRTPGRGDDYTAKGETPGYLIVRPVLVGKDILALCFMHGRNWDQDKIVRLLDERGIRHRDVKGEDNTTYVEIAASREELRALIRETPSEKLFPVAFPYRRVDGADGVKDRFSRWIAERTKSKNTGCPFDLEQRKD